MRLLVFTQKIDSEDPVLGFFHDWVDRLSYHFETISVICLEQGKKNLPKNVEVYSLGKESGQNRLKYIFNYYKHLINLSGSYDAVLVHMNQEYIILGGLYWKFKKIPVYLWRNHSKGSLITNLAVLLSTKVFCTSNYSYTAQFKKTTIMPAGIDTSVFKQGDLSSRKKYSVCMVGRISPVKHIDIGLEVVKDIVYSGAQLSFGIIGPVLEKDESYFIGLKKYVEKNDLTPFVSFLPAVSPRDLPKIYNEYQVCLNLTDTGSFDKTIVEASACGAVPLCSNESMRGLLPDVCIADNNKEAIRNSLTKLLDDQSRISIQPELEKFVESQSLDKLIKNLVSEIKNV